MAMDVSIDSFGCETYPSGLTLVDPGDNPGKRSVSATDCTPGSAPTFATNSRSNSVPFSSEYPAVNKLYDAISTLCGLNPRLIFSTLKKLRMNSPAQTSSTS